MQSSGDPELDKMLHASMEAAFGGLRTGMTAAADQIVTAQEAIGAYADGDRDLVQVIARSQDGALGGDLAAALLRIPQEGGQ
jgi:hypothetical protein